MMAPWFGTPLAAFTVSLLMLASSGGLAMSQSAVSYLKQLEGDWRGRGSAMIPGRNQAERITCQVSNRAEGQSLVVKGECASTQGKSPVSGRLTADGNRIGGTLINALQGASMTNSGGSVEGGNLVVSSSFVNNATGQLTRTRQIIRMGTGGFTAAFFTYDRASDRYEPSGEIRFSRK